MKLLSVLLCLLWSSAWSLPLKEEYLEARLVRIASGHNAAQSLYTKILESNPSDLTVSSRIAASNGRVIESQRDACNLSAVDKQQLARFREFLQKTGYTSYSIGSCVLGDAHHQKSSRSPLYLTPAASGTVHQLPFAPSSYTPLRCLISLFLVGIAVPIDICEKNLSEEIVELMKDLGLVCNCELDPNLLLSVVSIMPVDVKEEGFETIWIITDWHPRVLNTVDIEDSGDAVMYIGPDSLALVQHWILDQNTPPGLNRDTTCEARTLLDLCTGSGIQALASLAAGKCDFTVCVDKNKRALRFTGFSAALNGLSDRVTLVKGDLLKQKGAVFCPTTPVDKERKLEIFPLVDLLKKLVPSPSLYKYDQIIANPPFLPVPPSDSEQKASTEASRDDFVQRRHGLFSSGGASGEEVLSAILDVSRTLLKDNSFLAVVSEFFFRGEVANNIQGVSPTATRDLLARLRCFYCGEEFHANCQPAQKSRGLLLTNQFPISSTEYAERRADTLEEVGVWLQHLANERIIACSPGLLYVQKIAQNKPTNTICEENGEVTEGIFNWENVLIPKTTKGSIWTPTNLDAVEYSRKVCRRFFFQNHGLES